MSRGLSENWQDTTYYAMLFVCYTCFYRFIAGTTDVYTFEPSFADAGCEAGFSVLFMALIETALWLASAMTWKMGDYLSRPTLENRPEDQQNHAPTPSRKKPKKRKAAVVKREGGSQVRPQPPLSRTQQVGEWLKKGSEIIPTATYGLCDVYQTGPLGFFSSLATGYVGEQLGARLLGAPT